MVKTPRVVWKQYGDPPEKKEIVVIYVASSPSSEVVVAGAGVPAVRCRAAKSFICGLPLDAVV